MFRCLLQVWRSRHRPRLGVPLLPEARKPGEDFVLQVPERRRHRWELPRRHRQPPRPHAGEGETTNYIIFDAAVNVYVAILVYYILTAENLHTEANYIIIFDAAFNVI